MATIEQFNEELKRVIPNIRFGAVVWMHSHDIRCNETSIQERKNQLSVFRQVIAWKDTDHAAIIANGHVMAIWHAQPATVTAAAAQDADNVTQAALRQALRDVKAGRVHPVATLWDGIGDDSAGETGAYHWTAEELSAYDPDNPYPPHTPGATADDTLASYEYEIAALKMQLVAVIEERDAGNVERLRLRAALREIEDLPEDNFKIAWSIAVAALTDEPVVQGE